VLVVRGLKLPTEKGALGAKVRKRGARRWKSATVAKMARREKRKGRRRREERKPVGASLNEGLERPEVMKRCRVRGRSSEQRQRKVAVR
jgi:hypothetical protein